VAFDVPALHAARTAAAAGSGHEGALSAVALPAGWISAQAVWGDLA
jgi:hypothetical protein